MGFYGKKYFINPDIHVFQFNNSHNNAKVPYQQISSDLNRLMRLSLLDLENKMTKLLFCLYYFI